MSKRRIKELEFIIETLDSLFELGEECVNPVTKQVVLDNEYDALKKELLQSDSKSKIFTSVTASTAKIDGRKIIHDPPMTSISKCNGTQQEKEDMLKKWMDDCYGPFAHRAKRNSFFVMSLKHDGIALSIEYKNGKLHKAGLRSKSGKDGIDVTNKTKYIKLIPQKLPNKITCVVRGEIETHKSVFKKISDILGDDAKVNPRAHTAGSMNLKTAEEIKDRGLSFKAYFVYMEKPPYKTEIERAKWLSKMGFHYVKLMEYTPDLLKVLEEKHRGLDFMVDGVVLSVSNLEYQEDLGRHGNSDTGNPKGKIAWKFADEVKQVIVKDIEWQTGRTGNVTPVLIFNGVQLEETTIVRCTAHNLGIIKENKIGIGSIIEIIKSGKIIPKIHKVVKAKGSAHIPINCPSCKSTLKEVTGSTDALSLVCTSSFCSAQMVKTLNHYLTVIGVKGISESTVSKLIDAGMLSERSDFYDLWYDKLVVAGFTKRTAFLIDARIQMIPAPEAIKDNAKLITMLINSHQEPVVIPMAKFIASFGMDGAGKEAGRILTKKYGDFDKIRNLSISELENNDGIGTKTATIIYNFFKNNSSEIDKLLKSVKLEAPIVKNGKFSGKKFVLSGSIDGGKSYWRKQIELQGGEIKSSVSKKIHYVVAGDGSGSKSDKAKNLNIPIIDTDELEKMLQ